MTKNLIPAILTFLSLLTNLGCDRSTHREPISGPDCQEYDQDFNLVGGEGDIAILMVIGTHFDQIMAKDLSQLIVDFDQCIQPKLASK